MRRAVRRCELRGASHDADHHQTQNAKVNGVDIAYVERGRGQPVVFVHGGTGDWRTWEGQMDAFGAGHRAIALSCRGYWPNRKLDPDEPITLDTFVEDVAAFIRRSRRARST